MLTRADFKKWHDDDGDGDNVHLSRDDLLDKVLAELDFPDEHGRHGHDWSHYCGVEYDDFEAGDERCLELVLEPEFDDEWMNTCRMIDAALKRAEKLFEPQPGIRTERDEHILRIYHDG
jgi:hypothetical protein